MTFSQHSHEPKMRILLQTIATKNTRLTTMITTCLHPSVYTFNYLQTISYIEIGQRKCSFCIMCRTIFCSRFSCQVKRQSTLVLWPTFHTVFSESVQVIIWNSKYKYVYSYESAHMQSRNTALPRRLTPVSCDKIIFLIICLIIH